MTDVADRGRLAILVHEVRSPVAALAAIAETYRDPGLEPTARRSLADLAVAACRGIERVVSDASVASLRPEPVDLRRLAYETAGAWMLRGRQVRVSATGDLPRLEADPLRLRQALDNLVSNALAHSRPEDAVDIGVRSGNGALLLSVADTGPGIPRDEQNRIFEPGVRLEDDRPGMGLGLAVARAIAEAHGGTLTVESAPGRGATFTLSLPATS
jgi:signal transduction histidine kinase